MSMVCTTTTVHVNDDYHPPRADPVRKYDGAEELTVRLTQDDWRNSVHVYGAPEQVREFLREALAEADAAIAARDTMARLAEQAEAEQVPV